jgi:hypothetical protein
MKPPSGKMLQRIQLITHAKRPAAGMVQAAGRRKNPRFG